MNYLTEYYKNLSERLQSQLNSLEKELKEAQEPLYGARPLYGRNLIPSDEQDFDRESPGSLDYDYTPSPWNFLPWHEATPVPIPQEGILMPGPRSPAVRPLDPQWTRPLDRPQYKPNYPGGQRRPRPGEGDNVPDVFQQPIHAVPGMTPDVHGPPSPIRSSNSSSSYY